MTPEVDFEVYRQTLTSTLRAIKERVFYVKKDGKFIEPPRPSNLIVNTTLSHVRSTFEKARTYVTPMTSFQFAGSYRGSRHTRYLKAANDNLKLGFHDRLATVEAFMKCEKYNFTKKPDAVPRIIQPRNARYIVESGRYIKPIEYKIYRHLNELFLNDGNGNKTLQHKTVFKGLNAVQRGKEIHAIWGQYTDPIAIGIDAHRFDQHVSKAMLEWEHNIYKLYYPNDEHFNRLMKLQLVNKGACYLKDGKIKYEVQGCRMSGDSNTSLGNVLIMCSMIHSYRQKYNLNFSLVNDGDDCVLIMERQDEAKNTKNLESHFSSLGFTLTVEPTVDIFEQIEFCQCRPVWDGQNYLMVRDPRISISKDAVALKPLTTKGVYEKWCAAVGTGGMILTSGMPVLQEYYRYYKRCSNGAKMLSDPTLQGGLFRLGEGMNLNDREPTPESRASFYLAFGISPESQLAMEHHYLNLSTPHIVHSESHYRWANLPM